MLSNDGKFKLVIFDPTRNQLNSENPYEYKHIPTGEGYCLIGEKEGNF